MFFPDTIKSQVEAFKQEMNATRRIETFPGKQLDLTETALKLSSEMFIYLISCSRKLRKSYKEYHTLFQSQSLKQIILKLNDGMNAGNGIDIELFN